MNLRHVVLVFLCCVCVCVCDSDIIGSQTVQNPGDCNVTKCLSLPCTRVFFSAESSMCILLKCINDTLCDHFIEELGRNSSLKNGTDSLQPPSPPTKSPLSQSPTAPPASLTAFAAPSFPSVPHPDPEGNQRSASSNTADSGFSSNGRRFSRGRGLNTSSQGGALGLAPNTSSQGGALGLAPNTSSQGGAPGLAPNTSSQGGALGQSLNTSSQGGAPGQALNTSSQGGAPGQGLNTSSQVLNETMHQGQALNNSSKNGHLDQPPLKPFTSAPASAPLPIASVGAGGSSSTIPEDQHGAQVNKPGQDTTTTTSTTATSVKPALPTNSTAATNTTFITTTVTMKTTSTTSKVTSPFSTTEIQPASTPPPTAPPSPAPPLPPSVAASTPPSGQTPPTIPPAGPDVTSAQDKAAVPGAGGELASHMMNTSSLIAVLSFGLLFFIVTVILFLRHAYESYKRRGYTQMDYLINGMYSDSGL